MRSANSYKTFLTRGFYTELTTTQEEEVPPLQLEKASLTDRQTHLLLYQ
jgi:hypothetical protein